MTKDDAVPVTAEKEAAQEIRWDAGRFVRVFEREGQVIWSTVDDNMNDLTIDNSDGVLFHVRSVFVPHGAENPLARHRGSTAGVDVMPADILERAQANWHRFFYPERSDFHEKCGHLNHTIVPLAVADSLREVLNWMAGCDATGDPRHIRSIERLASLSQTPATPMVQEGLREAAQAVVDEAARMTMTMRRRKIFDALAAALAQEGEETP